MIRKLIILVLIFAVVSCGQKLPDLVRGITIGTIDSTRVYIKQYKPAIPLWAVNHDRNSLAIDVDDDEVNDFEFSYTYNFVSEDVPDLHWDVTASSLITILPLSNDFRLVVENVTDSVFRCVDETAPDYHLFEYTKNTGLDCGEFDGGSLVFDRVVQDVYCQKFFDHSSITSTLNWSVGQQPLFRQEFIAQGEEGQNVSNDNRTDLRMGFESWAEEAYLGICKVDTPRNRYGYIRFRLEEIEGNYSSKGTYQWELQIIETVFQH